MPLASRIPNVELEVPGEPGNYFTFKALSGEQFDLIAAVDQKDIASLQSTVHTLFAAGIVSWRGPNYDGAECDDANKQDLTADVRVWALKALTEIGSISAGEAVSSVRGSATNGVTSDDAEKDPALATPASMPSTASV